MASSDFFSDTHPEALEIWLNLFRNMEPERRVGLALDQSRRAFGMAEANVRILYPDADDREVQLRVASRHISRDLMIRAFEWDPEQHP